MADYEGHFVLSLEFVFSEDGTLKPFVDEHGCGVHLCTSDDAITEALIKNLPDPEKLRSCIDTDKIMKLLEETKAMAEKTLKDQPTTSSDNTQPHRILH